MKTKREVLEEFAKNGDCENINCKKECPYCFSDRCLDLDLRKIGAMAILRQNRKKRVFDKSKILTCVTADKAKVGMRGYFGDSLNQLKENFYNKWELSTLSNIRTDNYNDIFGFNNRFYTEYHSLFYPIDEV